MFSWIPNISILTNIGFIFYDKLKGPQAKVEAKVKKIKG